MEDDRERVFSCLAVHRDVVDVGAIHEEPVNGHRTAVGERHERSIRPRIRKDDDDDGRAAGAQGTGEQLCHDFAELFGTGRGTAPATRAPRGTAKKARKSLGKVAPK